MNGNYWFHLFNDGEFPEQIADFFRSINSVFGVDFPAIRRWLLANDFFYTDLYEAVDSYFSKPEGFHTLLVAAEIEHIPLFNQTEIRVHGFNVEDIYSSISSIEEKSPRKVMYRVYAMNDGLYKVNLEEKNNEQGT